MEEKLSPQYNDAVKQIKTAILRSQTKALAGVNQEQLSLYYGIGRFISQNSRSGFWGKDAIATISRQLRSEVPGLRGFSETNLRMMRIFYEEWRLLEPKSSVATDDLQAIDTECPTFHQLQLPNYADFPITLSRQSLNTNRPSGPSRCSKMNTSWTSSTLSSWEKGKRTLMKGSSRMRLLTM